MSYLLDLKIEHYNKTLDIDTASKFSASVMTYINTHSKTTLKNFADVASSVTVELLEGPVNFNCEDRLVSLVSAFFIDASSHILVD